MAPEVTQANNAQPYDGQAADVWSLGVILYVLVSCAYPFGYDGPKEQVQTAGCRAPFERSADLGPYLNTVGRRRGASRRTWCARASGRRSTPNPPPVRALILALRSERRPISCAAAILLTGILGVSAGLALSLGSHRPR